MNLTHGSLFTGIGGFELGAKMAGIKTLWNYEIKPYCNLINKQNFPDAVQFRDIRRNKYPPHTDIISMGSPCQDISISGNGGGIFGSRSSLFFDGMQIVRNTGPGYVIFENSPEILKDGFEYVLREFSSIGYNAEWQVLSGKTFGIQQNRKRLYLIAYSNRIQREGTTNQPIFSERILQEQFIRISPGWRTRWDIPKPRNFRSTNDLPNIVDRVEGLGNAVMPLVAKYLFECIKFHSVNSQKDAG